MDLRSLKIHVAERRVEVVVRDAAGEVPHVLVDASFERVMQAAEPLLQRLGQEGGGPVLFVSVDPDAGELLATCMSQPQSAARASREADMMHQHGGVNMGEVGEVPSKVGALVLRGADYLHVRSLLRELARTAVREARPRKPDLPEPPSAAAAWEHKYLVGSDGWELMRPAPPLHRWLAEHAAMTAPGTLALVPGCGRGHEARLLAGRGVHVLAIDIAPTAVAETTRLAGEQGGRLEVMLADLFELPAQPAHAGRYDLVLEHCCFCAVDPARRDEYVDAVHALLRPGGLFLGLFWCHDQPGGPPYGATRHEVEERLRRRLTLTESAVPDDSILTRAGQELLVLAEKRI